jgi:hypothetical protein
LLRRLEIEPDHGLRVAYASALGQLRAEAALAPLLHLLDEEMDTAVRLELALALARLLGEEHHFVQLVRQTRSNAGTVLAQELLAVSKKLPKEVDDAALRSCAVVWSQEEVEAGIADFGRFLQSLPPVNGPQQILLAECQQRLAADASRLEYVLLALLVLNQDNK